MYNPLLLPDLRQMLEENDTEGLKEFCEALYPGVTAEVLEGLDVADVWRVLSNCDLERQVEIIEFMDLPLQAELVQDLDQKQLTRLLEEMAPDDRADLLARMDPDRVEDLLPLIAQAERSDIRKLLSYPEDSAGSIMTTDYASLPEDITVREALERLRRQAPDRETIYYVYIIDEGRRLRGMLSLRELILAKPDVLVSEIAAHDVLSVQVDDDQENVAQELAKYDFIAIPVVDNQNRLVGIVTHDDALDVMQEEATEDAHRLGAVQPLQDSYLSTPLHTIAWKRGVWLVFLALVALVTAVILKHYKALSEQYEWMIWFLPLVLAGGGNAGSQSATLVIRTLALEQLTASECVKMAFRELLAGLGLGACLALIGFVAAYTGYGCSLPEAAVVALTVCLVVVIGTVSGAVLPLGFERLGMDPALMSTPLIAALVDVLGVVIYFTVAVLILGSVVG